jgi:hypothetical protein
VTVLGPSAWSIPAAVLLSLVSRQWLLTSVSHRRDWVGSSVSAPGGFLLRVFDGPVPATARGRVRPAVGGFPVPALGRVICAVPVWRMIAVETKIDFAAGDVGQEPRKKKPSGSQWTLNTFVSRDPLGRLHPSRSIKSCAAVRLRVPALSSHAIREVRGACFVYRAQLRRPPLLEGYGFAALRLALN